MDRPLRRTLRSVLIAFLLIVVFYYIVNFGQLAEISYQGELSTTPPKASINANIDNPTWMELLAAFPVWLLILVFACVIAYHFLIEPILERTKRSKKKRSRRKQNSN